jgi:hypothetical protein
MNIDAPNGSSVLVFHGTYHHIKMLNSYFSRRHVVKQNGKTARFIDWFPKKNGMDSAVEDISKGPKEGIPNFKQIYLADYLTYSNKKATK